MTGPNPNYRSPLGLWLGETPDLEVIKRQGWRELRILVIRPDDRRLESHERDIVKRIGERLYGAKEKDHG